MTELEKLRSSPIEPIYQQAAPNEPIELGQLPVEFEYKGEMRRFTASFAMRFIPKERLEVFIPMESEPRRIFWGLGLINEGTKKFSIVGHSLSFDAFCTAASDDLEGAVFTPTRSVISVTQPSNALTFAVFHLLNFPEFLGPEDCVLVKGDPPHVGYERRGRVILRADGWRVTIASTDHTETLAKALSTQGGYAITHVSRVEREDGSEFSSEGLEALLGGLHHFLSFALGRWAGLAFVAGFDAGGVRRHEQWGLRITADGEWSGASSWLDSHHAEVLSETFPGFMALWTSALWNRPLRHSLYWFLGACDRRVGIGTDTGLILAQAALEVLAWTHCVVDKKLATAKEFKPGGLSAARKLRLLGSSLGIPLVVPPHFGALQAAMRNKWKDGADVIAGIRNSLVHPNSASTLGTHEYFEAWKLSLWFVEMVLLRLCGDTGNYANRLAAHRWAGEVELVPWTKP